MNDLSDVKLAYTTQDHIESLLEVINFRLDEIKEYVKELNMAYAKENKNIRAFVAAKPVYFRNAHPDDDE